MTIVLHCIHIANYYYYVQVLYSLVYSLNVCIYMGGGAGVGPGWGRGGDIASYVICII